MSYYEDHLRRQREEHERLDEKLRQLRQQRYTHEQKAAIVAAFFNIGEDHDSHQSD